MLGLVLLALVGGQGAADTRAVDLRKKPPDVSLTGAYKVAAGGDVNGDGIPDLLVSKGSRSEEPSNGVVYVVFGNRKMKSEDLEQPGDGGFLIHGTKVDDGASVIAIAGDVNGDGLDDILIGAPLADNNARSASGSVYLVFGKEDTLPISLAQFDANLQGPLGYRIDGAYQLDLAGRYLDAAGDINADGLDDVVIAAPLGGATYVVFGTSSPLPIDLRRFHEGSQEDSGFLVKTPRPYLDTLYSVAGAGDVNGDGTPDVIIGVFKADWRKRGGFVVFGKSSNSTVEALDLGRHGFRIRGFGGNPVERLGDVNRDGLDDLIYFGGGPTFVVFGKRSREAVDLDNLGRDGFAIKGREYDRVHAVSGIRDLNGDRRPELLLGSPLARHNGRRDSGSTFVVYGKGNTGTVKLWNLGSRGYRIDGANENYASGYSVASSPDINGDGRPEILIGSPGDADSKGAAYLLWGDASP